MVPDEDPSDPTVAALPGRFGLEDALREALDVGQLQVFYQPKIGLADERLSGFEALLRWNRPGIGFIPPDRFIPVAEECGLVVAIGAWVLREASLQAQAFAAHMGRPIGIAVNISAQQLMGEHLLYAVNAALSESGLDPGLLTLEITESKPVTDAGFAVALLKTLRDRGIRISIDDFGIGRTSIDHFVRLPVDELKIDRSFVASVDSDELARSIVRSIVGMARSAGIETVAEGVETPAQLAQIAEIGCDTAQGHLFAPALPASAALATIAIARHNLRDVLIEPWTGAEAGRAARTTSRPPGSLLP